MSSLYRRLAVSRICVFIETKKSTQHAIFLIKDFMFDSPTNSPEYRCTQIISAKEKVRDRSSCSLFKIVVSYSARKWTSNK